LFSTANAGSKTTTATRRGCCGRRSPAFEEAGLIMGHFEF
jgi:hypothetical protein